MPVGEMLERISSRELTEWRAHFMLQADPHACESPDEFIRRTSGDK